MRSPSPYVPVGGVVVSCSFSCVSSVATADPATSTKLNGYKTDRTSASPHATTLAADSSSSFPLLLTVLFILLLLPLLPRQFLRCFGRLVPRLVVRPRLAAQPHVAI
jgi:hypothetical protein